MAFHAKRRTTMKHFVKHAFAAGAVTALLSGCQVVNSEARRISASGDSVNTEVARLLSQDAERPSQIRLGASDRFGATIHEHYILTRQESRD
jgi:hypothetical protein